ncbi:MAG: DNA/RNA non-specific endonuclease [Drouetiella hepatica Uher 2000/2452]|jgi:endonuclease G|uniref:DNA/RNA non-specific endonuclease n=1 Tax=Drouetiella hepatica Uher 2000/2452 TaxID=904376 RepID=A0A951UMH0_9CYAN|nr:DNA/RNA non-specific endonuclease [Drouetiella hepatica Uher 2000/2452]
MAGVRWKWVGGLLISAIALLSLSGCATVISQINRNIGNPHLLLGNPSAAIASLSTPSNYLISRPQYALSYNRDKGIPNWVSWQLNETWLGSLPRPQFEPDTSLPKGWYQVSPDDYTGSGFDRGHVLPAADRNRDPQDSQSTFLMTNILPQAADSNRGPWEQLESYCRALVRTGKELYIVAGSAGTGGVGEKGKRSIIGRGKVAVPASTWKVIVVLDRSGLGLADITTLTRTIAVNMPNQQGIKDRKWQDFKTSIDEIEKLTGYNLLSNVAPAVQTAIEAL